MRTRKEIPAVRATPAQEGSRHPLEEAAAFVGTWVVSKLGGREGSSRWMRSGLASGGRGEAMHAGKGRRCMLPALLARTRTCVREAETKRI